MTVSQKATATTAAFCFLFAACTTNYPSGFNPDRIADWARAKGFVEQKFQFDGFWIGSFYKTSANSSYTKVLVIYIEGDGAAWPNRRTPPDDPTPAKPVALWLAEQDAAAHVVYLGRPCQYGDISHLECSPIYWTSHRFSETVISSYSTLIDRLKQIYNTESIRLVGYSGGGVVAALLTARRNDVASLITVAAPLSLRAWVKHHKMSSLSGSLDPIDAGKIGSNTRYRVHYLGTDDKTVPLHVLTDYQATIDPDAQVVEVVDFDHECCWAQEWNGRIDTFSGRVP